MHAQVTKQLLPLYLQHKYPAHTLHVQRIKDYRATYKVRTLESNINISNIDRRTSPETSGFGSRLSDIGLAEFEITCEEIRSQPFKHFKLNMLASTSYLLLLRNKEVVILN